MSELDLGMVPVSKNLKPQIPKDHVHVHIIRDMHLCFIDLYCIFNIFNNIYIHMHICLYISWVVAECGGIPSFTPSRSIIPTVQADGQSRLRMGFASGF